MAMVLIDPEAAVPQRIAVLRQCQRFTDGGILRGAGDSYRLIGRGAFEQGQTMASQMA